MSRSSAPKADAQKKCIFASIAKIHLFSLTSYVIKAQNSFSTKKAFPPSLIFISYIISSTIATPHRIRSVLPIAYVTV